MPGYLKESLNITGYIEGAYDSIWLTTLPIWGLLEKINICWKPIFKGNTHYWALLFVNCFMEWLMLRRKKLSGSLTTKESSTIGTCRVFSEYSRIPTNKKHWGRSPVSQLLMPGYLKESMNITGYTVWAYDSIWLTTLPMWGLLEKINICWKPLFKGNTH